MNKYYEDQNIIFTIRALIAGILIGISCIVYCNLLHLGQKVIGSILFSFALIIICHYNLNLFTGKIGYIININKKSALETLTEILMAFLFNFIGVILICMFYNACNPDKFGDVINVMYQNKVSVHWYTTLFNSIGCGVLMFIAVNTYRESENKIIGIIAIIFCVSIFILCGFEHCIANFGYMCMTNPNLSCGVSEMVLFNVLCVIGNTIGSVLIHLLFKFIKQNKEETN